MVADPVHGWHFLDALVAWLLTYALHSTVFIAAAWVAAVCLARAACGSSRLRDALPSIRERLWKLALVGGLATAGAQALFGFDPWGLGLGLRSNMESSSMERACLAQEPTQTAPKSVLLLAAPESAPATKRHFAPAALLRNAEPPAATVAATETSWMPGWIQLAVGLWAAGVLFGLARWACQWNRLLRNLDDREPILSGHVYEIFQHLRLRSHSRAKVGLFAAPGLHAPITLGLRRYAICLPPRVASELQHDEIGALLAHELAHAERRDPVWVVACRAIEIVFFFQPLNKMCAGWLSDEAEYLCDDRAVVQIGERVALASCLTEIAGWIVHSTPTRLAPGMAAPGTRLSLRVSRLLDEDHDPEAPRTSRWFTAAMAPAALSVAVFVPGVAAEAPEPHASPDGEVVWSAPEGTELSDRTRDLELAWQAEPPSPAAAVPADPAPSVTVEVPTSEPVAATDVFDDLEAEVDRMRAELATRTGGKTLARRLDALDTRLKSLRNRARELQARIDQMADAAPSATEQTPAPDQNIPTFPLQAKD